MGVWHPKRIPVAASVKETARLSQRPTPQAELNNSLLSETDLLKIRQRQKEIADSKSNSVSQTLRTSINIPEIRLGGDRTRVNRDGKVVIVGERVYNFDFETNRTEDEPELETV